MKLRHFLPALLFSSLACGENEIGFIEKFALAKDRAAVLTQLVPGTEDYYFFHALHFQNTRQAPKLAEMMEQWGKRFPDSERRKIIENREALLAYDADPQRTLKFLRERLQLEFNDAQQVRDLKPDLPTALDPARIARTVFATQALQADDLASLNDAALEMLVREKVALRPPQRRALLARLARPDLPGLVELIAADLKTPEKYQFGEFPIHKALLPEQLEALLKLVPAVAENEQFVLTRLRKLHAGADEDIDFDPAARDAWLTRAWDYAKTLSPAFNTLKATILRQRLEFDRERGVYNKPLFLEYLKLPRRMDYVNVRYLETQARTGPEVDVNRGFTEILPLPPIAQDEPLVRAFFLHLFATEESWEPYTNLVRDTWLKPVFAEAKIVNGVGDPEKWASLLTPAAFGRLKERVDVEFAPQNPRTFAPAAEVTMELFVKNAPKLIVKIYEINTLSYFLTQKRQLNTDLNLDGLVANTERTVEFANDPAAKNPFRRVLRALQFPELKGRGAWMVELIGSGKSSRALIRKGQWSLLQQSGPAGDLITVLDETRTPVKDAAVWLDGRKFAAMPAPAAKADGDAKKAPGETTTPPGAAAAPPKADAAGADGRILIPFTGEPGRKPLVLADAAGTFATLAEFDHHAENYALDVQFYVEREQLLAGRQATLVIRAALLLNDAQISLDLVQDAKLTITSTTLDGISTTSEVKGLKFTPEKVFLHQFKVPARLYSLSATLSGRVDRLAKGGEKQDLSAEESWEINGLDKSEATRTGHLSKIGEGYVYELLGKNGEPVADQQIVFQFRHREFREQTVTLALRTDEKGRVTLGVLEGIARVDAPESGRNRIWYLQEQGRTRPELIHAKTGTPIQIPWARDFEPGSYSLLELRGGTFVADRSRHILIPPLGPYIRTPDGKSKPGLKLPFITIENLPPGDYSLRLREEEDREIAIRVTDGQPVAGWLLGANRELEIREPAPLHIANVKVGGDAIEVILANFNRFARVHVTASRYLPEDDDFHLSKLARFNRFTPRFATPERLPNLYSGGRDIGDEYRYILERRYTVKYPGNMLPRPGLLINPWEKRSTDAQAQSQSATQAAAATAGGRRATAAAAKPMGGPQGNVTVAAEHGSPNLDFLANAAPVIFNLVPDANGIVRIERKLLGDRQHLQIYAEDLANAAWRSVALEEAPTKFQELRLVRNLDPAKPFTEKKDVAVLTKGQTLILADVLTSDLETYDTLSSVFSLFATLSQGNATLAKFGWILDWPKLKPEEKRAKYSEFACHELNFFLSRKDPEFFAATVQPYLRNKKDKTFMDDYLVGTDLARYLEPWAYARLNVVERALLGQRLPNEAASAARHLRELWELLPPNPEEQDRLFETALRGRSLSAAGGALAALGDAKEERERLMPAQLAAPASPAPAAPAAKGGANRLAGATGRARFAGAALAEAAPAAEEARLSRNLAAEAKVELAVRADTDGLAKAKKDVSDKLATAVFDADFSKQVDHPEKDYFFAAGDALQQRGFAAAQAYYRKLGPTKEWAENNYYQLPLDQQHAGLVTINAFWRDFAAWVAAGAKAPFLSAHLAEAHRNFSEMMLALAVIDLPFDEPKHETKTDGGAFTFNAAGPVIAFHRQIKPAAPAKEAVELLVSQNFYRHGDRHRVEGNEKLDKYVTAEFLTGVVYGANIVVTNPTSSPQKLTLLLQIPQGALPVLGSKPTDSRNLRLEPYTTQQLDYFFYFPAPTPEAKPFPHFPVHVAKAEAVVGSAKAFAFKVVRQLSEIDKASWDYISQYGSDADVFAFLEQNNAARLDVARIAWRARKSVDFFRKLVALLEKLHVWSEPIYRYSIVHNEPAALREWLRHRDDFIARCGPWLEAKVVRIDAIERRAYEHLEYTPLVNQRIHRLGAENRITNSVFRGQYQTLLQVLAHKPQLDPMEEMSVVYYLFLQDRIEEGLARFATIQPAALPTRLQHDYFRCYASLYEEKLADARQIAAQYAGYGVDRWRGLFTEVVAQLDEIEGKAAQRPGDNLPNREKQQAELAGAAPTFDLKVENRTVSLTWKNLREVTLNYYLMDPEFLFSANPFVSEDSSRFSFIKPTKSARQPLPEGKDALEVPLPAEFAKANVLVEVLGAGQRKAQAYHANSFKLTLAANYGSLEVRDQAADGKAVSKAYVKVYARLRGGQIRFFKDGYTDLRGKFDYASLNSSDTPAPPQPLPVDEAGGSANLGYQMLRPHELPGVERLAILVLSDSHGALVREVNPPAL